MMRARTGRTIAVVRAAREEKRSDAPNQRKRLIGRRRDFGRSPQPPKLGLIAAWLRDDRRKMRDHLSHSVVALVM
jgi:hypothetical protein